MMNLVWFGVASFGSLLAFAALLHAIGRFSPGLSKLCCVAPGLDFLVFLLAHGPWIAAAIVAAQSPTNPHWTAFLGVAIASQVAAILIWGWAHELSTPGSRQGPRIVSSLNRRVGRIRNHAAVWWTALAVPLFTLIRIGELIIYPPLTWTVRLPKYRMSEWVMVSRQKFSGLVGHDLIWCLYCDWMTGVWSLGSEMLRNVESFWCPIRFSSPEKCANCSVDFPDINGGWVAHSKDGGTMQQVAAKIEEQYPGPNGVNAWFGHPVRLTVSATKKSPAPNDPPATR